MHVHVHVHICTVLHSKSVDFFLNVHTHYFLPVFYKNTTFGCYFSTVFEIQSRLDIASYDVNKHS